MIRLKLMLSIVILSAVILTGCGSGVGNSETSSQKITSFELLDPTPNANDNFGSDITILPNGNIVVTEPSDSSLATKNGAVHLYNPFTKTRLASFYGDNANDQLGSGGITVLANNNFIISSILDDVNGIIDAGSVILVNGATGRQINSTLAGQTLNDKIGQGGIAALTNNNFVITSQYEDINSIVNAGSVRLMNGTSGNQISILSGETAGDEMGNLGTTVLANNNYVVASYLDDENGIVDAGTVRLHNGTTGDEIAVSLQGDVANDLFNSKITALKNNNYVITSPNDDEDSKTNVGSVRLINGVTGLQMKILVGETINDSLGDAGITALDNSYYVIASRYDDEAGSADIGSVRLVNSAGELVSTLTGEVGDVAGDFLKNGGITAIKNNQYVIASPYANYNGVTNAGAVRLMNGTSGDQIGDVIAGDIANDLIGSGGITVLANNNYVIASPNDDENTVLNAGSVKLVDGVTGVTISTIAGDMPNDELGNLPVTALANNNYVIASYLDDENGITNAGSVRLMNGASGAQLGMVAGDNITDLLGYGSITAFANSNYVIASKYDDVSGIVDVGSITLMNGASGVQIGNTQSGNAANDIAEAKIIESVTHKFYIVSLKLADNNGMVNSGRVQLVVPQ